MSDDGGQTTGDGKGASSFIFAIGSPISALCPRRLSSVSIRRCAAGLDRAGPFVNFALHEIRKIRRRGAIIGNDLGSEAFEALLHQGSVHRLQGRLVELLDDRL